MKHSSFDATISALDMETSAFGAATSAIARRSFDATISALDAETSALGASTSAIARSYRRYRRGVSGDIGDCGVGITPQMCNRVIKPMLSYTISNKLTKGKNHTVPQNLDNPKNGQTLEQG